MTNPYRALCAELTEYVSLLDEPPHGLVIRAQELLDQSVEEGPTDEEIMELMPQKMRDDLAVAGCALAGFAGPNAAAACRIILNRHAVDHARAALAKYGTPTPQPVVVSERLPGPEDCDEEGQVWAWLPFDLDEAEDGDTWALTPSKWLPDSWARWTHWLPANALPTPDATNDPQLPPAARP